MHCAEHSLKRMAEQCLHANHRRCLSIARLLWDKDDSQYQCYRQKQKETPMLTHHHDQSSGERGSAYMAQNRRRGVPKASSRLHHQLEVKSQRRWKNSAVSMFIRRIRPLQCKEGQGMALGLACSWLQLMSNQTGRLLEFEKKHV